MPGDITSYESWGRLTVRVAGVRLEPSGLQLDEKPAGLVIGGEATVWAQWAEASGSGSASSAPMPVVWAEDAFDLQLLDYVELYTSVSGQAGAAPGSSQAYAYTDASIFLMNDSDCDYYVDLDLDWEYAVSGPASVALLVGSFFDDHFYRSVPEDDPLLTDSGGQSLQLYLPACGVEQIVMLADAEGEASVAPVPLPGAAMIGLLGISVAGWRLKRDRR